MRVNAVCKIFSNIKRSLNKESIHNVFTKEKVSTIYNGGCSFGYMLRMHFTLTIFKKKMNGFIFLERIFFCFPPYNFTA